MQNDVIKVLVVAGAMDVGGLENQMMYLIRNADKHKFAFDYTVYDENAYYCDEIRRFGGKCIVIPNTNKFHFLKYCLALYKVLKQGDYDIIHTNELFHSGLVLLTAKIAGVKNRFVHAHNQTEGVGEKPSIIRKLYNAVMRFLILHCATEFCACSTPAGEFLYKKEITKKENFHLIFNSMEPAKFIDNYEKVESGELCDDEWVNVVQVSRFSEVKNQLFTADIAKVLKQRGRKIRFVLAGDDSNSYGDKLKVKIKEDGLSEYILLLGVRSDIDILERKSNAFILPSLYEGMPLALIEAQATGIPCIVADTFSREIDFDINYIEWIDLKSGAKVWADAIENAVKKPRAPKEEVVNAIKRKGFTSEVFTEKVYNLYKNAYYKTKGENK